MAEIKDLRKKILAAFLCLVTCLLLIMTGTVYAEENGTDEAGTIRASFCAFDQVVTWDYPYSDDYFFLPSDTYSHSFARLSLGMALSAFRDTGNEEKQDDYLIDFLKNAGFEQIDTHTYAGKPTADSISLGLALKKIGDTTVIACAVCGGNYSAEWASNVTVGNDVRSEGFAKAAVKVEAELASYLEQHPVKGDLKLWIAGYSRGAAVANLTAADSTDSGIFKDVYAYTFATPLNTRNPGNYKNIFNIIRKDDIVPKIPLADWGFKRHGTDLKLVSQETDADCTAVTERIEALYKEMTGNPMVTNLEISYQLRTILDYLLLLLPDSATYQEYLQPMIVDILIKSDETPDAFRVLLKALEQFSAKDAKQAAELKTLRDYLGTLINVYYLQGRIKEAPHERWDQKLGVANLFNEHLPFKYLASMFSSDDPKELFSGNTSYIRLMIYGDVDAEIADNGNVIKTVLSDGTELVNGVEDLYSFPDVDCSDTKMVITLPADRSYTITLRSQAELPQTVTYTGALYSGSTVRAQTDELYSFLMSYNETAVISTSVNGRAIEPEKSDYIEISPVIDSIYSPSTAMNLENNSVVHLTISGLVNRLLFLLVILFCQMIASIILAVRRKKKRLQRNTAAATIWHAVMALLFLAFELSMWYFIPVNPFVKDIPLTLVTIVLIVYVWKGYKKNKSSRTRRTAWIFTAAIVAFALLNAFFAGKISVVKACILLLVYAAFFVATLLMIWKAGDKTGK